MADFIKNLSAEFVGLRRKEVVLTSAKREVKAFLPPSYLTEKEFEDSLGGFPESVWAASLVTPFRAGVKKYFVGWANYLKINPILKEN